MAAKTVTPVNLAFPGKKFSRREGTHTLEFLKQQKKKKKKQCHTLSLKRKY